MINYVEKGEGLHDLIAKSGHWLLQKDGVWVSSDDEAVQKIIDEYQETIEIPTPVRLAAFRKALFEFRVLEEVSSLIASCEDVFLQIDFEYSSWVHRKGDLAMFIEQKYGDVLLSEIFQRAAQI